MISHAVTPVLSSVYNTATARYASMPLNLYGSINQFYILFSFDRRDFREFGILWVKPGIDVRLGSCLGSNCSGQSGHSGASLVKVGTLL